MKITLCREEVLSCVIRLEGTKKPGEWDKSALKKLLKAMGLKAKVGLEGKTNSTGTLCLGANRGEPKDNDNQSF